MEEQTFSRAEILKAIKELDRLGGQVLTATEQMWGDRLNIFIHFLKNDPIVQKIIESLKDVDPGFDNEKYDANDILFYHPELPVEDDRRFKMYYELIVFCLDRYLEFDYHEDKVINSNFYAKLSMYNDEYIVPFSDELREKLELLNSIFNKDDEVIVLADTHQIFINPTIIHDIHNSMIATQGSQINILSSDNMHELRQKLDELYQFNAEAPDSNDFDEQVRVLKKSLGESDPDRVELAGAVSKIEKSSPKAREKLIAITKWLGDKGTNIAIGIALRYILGIG
jgi:hypothetical protein